MPQSDHPLSALLASVLISAAFLLPLSPALVQADPDSGITTLQGNTDAGDFHPTPSGISLPDSPAAADLLKRASREETGKRWENAADLYEQILTHFSTRVVEIDHGREQQSIRYLGVVQVVADRLAKWPDDGRTIYKGLFEQTADDLLNAAPLMDVASLSHIFWYYFATDAGKIAGIRLMDIYLEAGKFNSARWVGDRLLTLHPDLGKDLGIILFRAGLADHYCGAQPQAREVLKRLTLEDGGETGSIGGRSVRLSEALATVLATAVPVPTTLPTHADTYPRFGGNGDIPWSAAKLGSSAKSVQFALPGTLSPLGAKSAGSQSRSDSLANAIIPVVDNGDLFFQDGRTLYAVDSANESPLAGWLKTYPGEREGRFKIDVAGQPRKELLTVTVSPELVLAVMGQLDRLTLPVAARGTTIAPSKSTVRLVCLDRNSGRELWTRTTLDLPEAGTTLNHAEYDSTPLIIPREFAGRDESGVLDDSVLVTARTGRQNQFDECYLVCMSLKSGQYRWSTYLGGATHDTGAQTEPSQMTFSDGRVFVMTNLGAVAAIDPSDGRVIWLNSYPHDAGGPRQNILLANSRSNERPLGIAPTKAWAHNPVICCDGKVFVLPNDARNLFVCDASSGSGMNYFPLSYWGNADLLLGVQDDCVILNSQTKVFAVDWRKYLSGNNPSDATRWTTDISFIDGATTCGRGFATTESIFVPTTNRLVQITNGRARATYPVRGIFSEGQGPGNLLVTRSAIVVAGQKRIDIYRCPSVVGQR